MSRGGLEGARYERTTPQTVWEPGRPIQLGRSTSWVRAVYRARVLLAPPLTSDLFLTFAAPDARSVRGC